MSAAPIKKKKKPSCFAQSQPFQTEYFFLMLELRRGHSGLYVKLKPREKKMDVERLFFALGRLLRGLNRRDLLRPSARNVKCCRICPQTGVGGRGGIFTEREQFNSGTPPPPHFPGLESIDAFR